MSDTRAVWVERVEAWRESGERAEEFSRHEDFSAATLRWWASKLKRETAPDDVRLARVLRTPTEKQSGGAIVVEAIRSGALDGLGRRLESDSSKKPRVASRLRPRSKQRSLPPRQVMDVIVRAAIDYMLGFIESIIISGGLADPEGLCRGIILAESC